MRHLVFGAAIAALVSAAPVVAAQTSDKDASAASAQSADAGRGGLKEWPVSKEEADWSSIAPSSGMGASSGESGSAAGDAPKSDK